MGRRAEFKKPPPDGWTPQTGDQVWLPPRRPYLVSACGTVSGSLLGGYVKVRYSVNGNIVEAPFLPTDLRPYFRSGPSVKIKSPNGGRDAD